jgi:hypothetical protein
MKKRFRINLKDAHEKSGLTSYAVAKQLNINSPDKPIVTESTVRKYATRIVETDELLSHVIAMADFYGVDWHDPAIVEIIEGDEEDTKPVKTINEDESEGQIMTPLAAPA